MQKKLGLLLGVLLGIQLVVFTQETNHEEENIYESYLEQLGVVLNSRGLHDIEIAYILGDFRNKNIVDDESFATVLNNLYPSDRNIGFIFYYFKNSQLRVLFLEPGRVIEKKLINITEQELLALNNNISLSLSLFQKTANRSPKLRSSIKKDSVSTSKSTKLSFEESVKKASSILLPTKLNSNYKHVVVIPALNIGSVPFYLLRTLKDHKLMIEFCSYSVAPSIVDLIAKRYQIIKSTLPSEQFYIIDNFLRKKLNNEQDVALKNKVLHFLDKTNIKLQNALLIGNPSYPTNTSFVFPDLPGAKNEVHQVANKAKKYTLFESKKAIKDSILYYLPNSDIVYFATHGIANNENPMENSFLVLSGDDPFLTAKEIMNTRKIFTQFPKLAILSACQTGLGKYMNAGTVGLARSFLIAGSNHVIMSLWNVDDHATAFLMNRFIEHLQNKQSNTPSGALRLAVLDTKQKYTAPDKWASFSVFGVDY